VFVPHYTDFLPAETRDEPFYADSEREINELLSTLRNPDINPDPNPHETPKGTLTPVKTELPVETDNLLNEILDQPVQGQQASEALWATFRPPPVLDVLRTTYYKGCG